MPRCCECDKSLTSGIVICPDCLDRLHDTGEAQAIASGIKDSCFETFVNGGNLCIVLARSGNIALIVRMVSDKTASFVVPLEYVPGEPEWWQGHYFDDLGSAWEYYQSKIKEEDDPKC